MSCGLILACTVFTLYTVEQNLIVQWNNNTIEVCVCAILRMMTQKQSCTIISHSTGSSLILRGKKLNQLTVRKGADTECCLAENNAFTHAHLPRNPADPTWWKNFPNEAHHACTIIKVRLI